MVGSSPHRVIVTCRVQFRARLAVKMNRLLYQTSALIVFCPGSLPGLGYAVPGFPNGFPSFPGEALSFSAGRQPSLSSLRHSSVGEDSTHALIGPDEQVNLPLLNSAICRQ